MPISNSEHNQLVVAFRDDAHAYCNFIDEWQSSSTQEPFTTLLQLLSNIAKSASVLPYDSADKEIEEVERVDSDKWKSIATMINDKAGAACASLMAEHADDESAQTRVFMLWDDLADLYRDLRHGLDLFAFGDAEHIAEAVWQWRFGYESHWGEHLFRALMTVHEIRYRLYNP